MGYRGHVQGVPGLAEGGGKIRPFDPEADLVPLPRSASSVSREHNR